MAYRINLNEHPCSNNALSVFSEKKNVTSTLIKSCLFLWMRWLLDTGSTLNGMTLLLTTKFFPIRVDPYVTEHAEQANKVIELLSLKTFPLTLTLFSQGVLLLAKVCARSTG